MAEQIVDNRIMKLNKNEYKLKVKKIILTDVLKMVIDIQLVE